MNMSNAYTIGFIRAHERLEFITPLEIAARCSTDSEAFCQLWTLYEYGYAEGMLGVSLLALQREQGTGWILTDEEDSELTRQQLRDREAQRQQEDL